MVYCDWNKKYSHKFSRILPTDNFSYFPEILNNHCSRFWVSSILLKNYSILSQRWKQDSQEKFVFIQWPYGLKNHLQWPTIWDCCYFKMYIGQSISEAPIIMGAFKKCVPKEFDKKIEHKRVTVQIRTKGQNFTPYIGHKWLILEGLNLYD